MRGAQRLARPSAGRGDRGTPAFTSRLRAPLASDAGLARSDATDWPPLPRTGFIKGRPATRADVESGDAVFFLSSAGGRPVASAAPVAVPQYAYLVDGQGARRPVVMIQAEASGGCTLFGAEDAEGNRYVATEAEIELLGLSRP